MGSSGTVSVSVSVTDGSTSSGESSLSTSGGPSGGSTSGTKFSERLQKATKTVASATKTVGENIKKHATEGIFSFQEFHLKFFRRKSVSGRYKTSWSPSFPRNR